MTGFIIVTYRPYRKRSFKHKKFYGGPWCDRKNRMLAKVSRLLINR